MVPCIIKAFSAAVSLYGELAIAVSCDIEDEEKFSQVPVGLSVLVGIVLKTISLTRLMRANAVDVD